MEDYLQIAGISDPAQRRVRIWEFPLLTSSPWQMDLGINMSTPSPVSATVPKMWSMISLGLFCRTESVSTLKNFAWYGTLLDLLPFMIPIPHFLTSLSREYFLILLWGARTKIISLNLSFPHIKFKRWYVCDRHSPEQTAARMTSLSLDWTFGHIRYFCKTP